MLPLGRFRKAPSLLGAGLEDPLGDEADCFEDEGWAKSLDWTLGEGEAAAAGSEGDGVPSLEEEAPSDRGTLDSELDRRLAEDAPGGGRTSSAGGSWLVILEVGDKWLRGPVVGGVG